MSLPELVGEFFRERRLKLSQLLVAVSGGIDSTALLLALDEMPGRTFALAAVHLNHRLRGQESDLDQQFVEELCSKFSIPLHVVNRALDSHAVRDRGVEAAAREIRYHELHTIRKKIGADYVATAHQMDDQAETVLLRFVTGSGLGRLRGISAATSDRILRPLLSARREAVEQYLAEKQVSARLDSSNLDRRYLRNTIRHEVLPLLRQINPQVVPAIAATAQLAREQEQALDEILNAVSSRWLARFPDETDFDLGGTPENLWLRQAILAREIRRLDPQARDISAKDLARLARTLPRARRTSVTRRLELIRGGNLLILRKVVPRPIPFSVLTTDHVEIDIPAAGLTGRIEEFPNAEAAGRFTDRERTRQCFQLPVGAEPAFEIRNRRSGDRFHPLGSRYEKKLNEFLIDRKISLPTRDRIPILIWNGKIVWVGGVEVSESFKVSEPDAKVYRISIEWNDERRTEADPSI